MKFFGRNSTLRSGLTAAVAACALLASPVAARELRIAHGFGPDSATHHVYRRFAEALATGTEGALTGRVYPMTLLSFMESASGLRDGIADFALVVTPYFASDFPRNAAVLEFSSLAEGVDGDRVAALRAIKGALIEYVMLECTDCHEEFARHNQLVTALGTTARYILMCNTTVNTLADLQGLRLRAAGGYWARWAVAAGATPVQMSGSEVFEALNQNAIDCHVAAAAELTNISLVEVVTHVNLTGPGAALTSALANINLDTWRSLSPEHRTAVLRAAAAVAADAHWQYTGDEEPSLALAREQGIPVVESDPSILEFNRAFILDDFDRLQADYAANYGIEGLDEARVAIQRLFERWLPLVQGVETAEEFGDLLWAQVHSRVDVNAYGL